MNPAQTQPLKSIPVNISFQEIPSSQAVRERIEARVAKLHRYYDKLIDCDVVISSKHRRAKRGTFYMVRIHLSLPKKDLIVSQEPGDNKTHTDVYISIRDAFNALERQLKAHAEIRRREVKTEVLPPVARVKTIFPEQGYGFLETPDGREIYFHQNSVVTHFERLKKGSEVAFAEEMGEKGPQASSLREIGKNGKSEDRTKTQALRSETKVI